MVYIQPTKPDCALYPALANSHVSSTSQLIEQTVTHSGPVLSALAITGEASRPSHPHSTQQHYGVPLRQFPGDLIITHVPTRLTRF